jgi:hypothetical protein
MIPAQIEQVGHAFHRAFKEIDLSDAPGFLPHFPEGCCSWSTWMVGHFLKFECGLEPIEIQGTRLGDSGTDNHAWVSANGVIVDLTCGQYKDCPNSFIISCDSAWHSQWEIANKDEIRPINFYDFPGFPNEALPSEIYERLAHQVRSQLA